MSKISIIYIFIAIGMGAGTALQYAQHNRLTDSLDQANAQCAAKLKAVEAGLKAGQEVTSAGAVKPSVLKKRAVNKTIEPVKLVEAAKNDEKPLLQTPKESLDDIVRRKYRFLLARLQLDEEQLNELVRLLKMREQVYLRIQDAEEFADELNISKGQIADLRYELEEIDEQIEALIGDEETSSRFSILKNSDEEQHEFSQYTLGINGLFPLNQQQQEQVLLTRLKHKQAFNKALEDAGLYMDFPLSYDQQQELLGRVDLALAKYKEVYLNGVRPHLDFDDTPMNQYALLENYTNTEFEQMREALRKRIHERGVID